MKNLPYKILIVEDEPSVLEFIETCFNGNHELSTAFSIKDAREKLKKNRPDILILDRGLPDGDGVELCVELRKDPQYSSLPILMLTGKGETQDKVFGIKLGADDYLAKPFEPAELNARVEALLRRVGDLNIRRSIKKSLWQY